MTDKEKLKKENIEFIEKAQGGDKKALNTVVKNNLNLVYSLSKKFLNRGFEDEEIYQIGSIGLIKSIQKFNINSGNQFSTYAVPMILGEIQRFLRDNNTLIKVSRSVKILGKQLWFEKSKLADKINKEPTNEELAEYTGHTAEEVTEALNAINQCVSLDSSIKNDSEDSNITLGDKIDSGFDLEETAMQNIKYQKLYNCINKLPEKQKNVILLRLKDKTQLQTAKILGISQVQISRLEKKAHLNLRKLLESDIVIKSKKDEAFELFKQGNDNKTAMELLGVKPSTIEMYRSIYNRSKGTIKQVTGKKNEAFKMFEKGLNPKEISKNLGLKLSSVQGYRTEFNAINKINCDTEEKKVASINIKETITDNTPKRQIKATVNVASNEQPENKEHKLLTPTAFNGSSFEYRITQGFIRISDKKQSEKTILIPKENFDLFVKELLELKGAV